METPSVQSQPVESPTTTDGALSFQGLLLVFTNPVELFTRVKANPKIVVPYLTILVLSVALFVMIGDIIVRFIMQEMQRQAATNPQIAESLKVMTPGMLKGWQMGGAVAAILLGPLLAAALALFWGNFVFSGRARFSQILSVVLFGEVIYAFGNLLNGFMILAKDSMYASFSPAVLVADRGLNDWLYTLLSKINPFLIWEVVAIGIGLSILFNFPRNKGYLLSVLSVGMISIIHILWVMVMA